MPRRSYANQFRIAGAAVLGGLIGNVPGAFIGAYAEERRQRQVAEKQSMKRKYVDGQNDRYQHKIQKVRPQLSIRTDRKSLLPPKKSMPKSNPVNALVQRSSMKVTGKTAVKKTKKVKVPDLLRKQIKQVIVGHAAYGSYRTIKCGYVGSIYTTAGATPINGDDQDSNMRAVYFQSTANDTIPGRTLYNQLVQIGVEPAITTIVPGTGLNFFTPGKIIDAASVCFNGKTPSLSPYDTFGNLSTVTAVANGDPNVNSVGKLKINVLNSYAQFSIKNVSNRIVTMEIWECTPTLMFQPGNALASLVSSLTNLSSTANTDSAFLYYRPANGPSAQYSLYDPALDPCAIAKENFEFKFKWKKRLMQLNPEETCIHSIQGPKGILDYSKIVQTNQVTPDPGLQINRNTLFKNWSVSCIIGVSGDQVLATNPAGLTAGGRKIFETTTRSTGMPVAIEVQEFYKFSVPEVAGFRNADVVSGESQMLTFRKQKNVVLNAVEGGTFPYVLSNETAPILETALGNLQQN